MPIYRLLCTKVGVTGLKSNNGGDFSPPLSAPIRGVLLLRCNHLEGDRGDEVVAQAHGGLVLTGRLDGRGDLDLALVDRAETGGRYGVSLVNIRKIHVFIFHRRQGDVLILHLADTKFARLQSVRYPRNGKPSVITDVAFAEADFQQQLAFWFGRIPGR